MDDHDLTRLLEAVSSGETKQDDAAATLRRLPFVDLGFSRVDHHRELRTGLPEAVYAPGKSPEQCAAIVEELLGLGTGPVLLTRANEEQVDAALERSEGGLVTSTANSATKLSIVSWRHGELRTGRIVVVTAGTGDLPVAQECAATLTAYGFMPNLLADCGVAGVHRLFSSIEVLADADAVVVVAGMEGALASIIGGLTPAPIVAIPTSVGYGSSFDGITAMLAMHASCAAGITVVGIDNGFGAASAVARMLR